LYSTLVDRPPAVSWPDGNRTSFTAGLNEDEKSPIAINASRQWSPACPQGFGKASETFCQASRTKNERQSK